MEDKEIDILPQTVVNNIKEQGLEAFKSLGFTEESEKQCRDLIKIGVHVKEEGLLNHQRGVAVFNQTAVMEAMAQVKVVLQRELKFLVGGRKMTKVDRVEVCERLAKMLVLMSEKLTRSQEIMMEMSGGAPAITTGALPEKLNKAFRPGSEVKGGTLVLAQNVQFNDHTAQAPKKTP